MPDNDARLDGRTAKGLKIDPQVAKNADAAPQTDVTRGRATDNLLALRSITAEFVRRQRGMLIYMI